MKNDVALRLIIKMPRKIINLNPDILMMFVDEISDGILTRKTRVAYPPNEVSTQTPLTAV